MMVALHWQNCVLTLDIIVPALARPWQSYQVCLYDNCPGSIVSQLWPRRPTVSGLWLRRRDKYQSLALLSSSLNPEHQSVKTDHTDINPDLIHGFLLGVQFSDLISDLDPGRQCPASQSKDGWSLNWSRSLDPTTTNSPWSSSAQRRRSWGQRLMTFPHWWHFDWKTKVRQKRVQNWVIHPMSQFRWTIFNLQKLSFFPHF